MSDLISREAAPLPCPLCSADMGIEGEGWEHPASDDCPLDSLFILPHHVTAWNRRALPTAQEAAPAGARESADMPYRIFTDTSRVWLDDDDGGSLFAYVREGAAPAVKVKPLVWRRGSATTKFGRYLLVEQEDGGESYWYVMFERRTVTTAGIHATEEAAKAAAQADYEARILAALEGGEA